MTAGGIQIIVFQKHRSRQHNISKQRRLGHELFMHDGKQVLTAQAFEHAPCLGSNNGGVGILHKQSSHFWTTLQVCSLTTQDATNTRLIKCSHILVKIKCIVSCDQTDVDRVDVAVAVQGTPSSLTPRTG